MSGQFIVAIVFISVFAGLIYDIYKKHMEFKEKTLNLSEHSDIKNQHLEKEITELKQRIEVLEKIVTEEGYEIKKEINRL